MVARTRFAPSPTGKFHVGGARTALYSWLLARQLGGEFIVRIEDTDSKRYDPEATSKIFSGLEYLGLDWDECPSYSELLGLGCNNLDAQRWDRGQIEGRYRQSNRTAIYKEAALDLVKRGQAYCVFGEELDLAPTNGDRKFSELSKEMKLNDWRVAPKDMQLKRMGSEERYHIRLKLPRHHGIDCYDAVRGVIKFKFNKLKDPVIIKSDGGATYHLASVVDDHHQDITYVLRGEEWLSSFPIHSYLYKVLEWTPPTFAHLPVILNPVGKGKMSKRASIDSEIPVFVEDYKKLGYLQEAMINYLAMLGWNPKNGKEYMSRDSLIKLFSLDGVNRSGSRWDIKKLQHMNQYYIKKLTPVEFAERSMEFVE